MKKISKLHSSFRDPAGFMFYHEGSLYRQLNNSAAPDYEAFCSSGFKDALIKKQYIVDYIELSSKDLGLEEGYKYLKPTLVPYISYPYEWSFSQLKDAALLTLKIQRLALDYGFTLKDASAYNIQFLNAKPIFIDTLSFEPLMKSHWVAYKQFCQHFLAPLLLRKNRGQSLSRLLMLFIDGIPLDLASRLMTKSTWFSFGALAHIHLHAKAQKKYSDAALGNGSSKLKQEVCDKTKLVALIDNLIKTVSKLDIKNESSEWNNYYDNNNYTAKTLDMKAKFIEEILKNKKEIYLLADIGANNGKFSRIAANYANQVVSFDLDELVIEKNYNICKKESHNNILPLVLDLCNPSAAIGWNNQERDSFKNRANFDVTLALALIHHLAISNNLPLDNIADFFSQITNDTLIIEFISKDDSMVKKLLMNRSNDFPNYNENNFEIAFERYFNIDKKSHINSTNRTIYSLKKK